MKWIIFFSILLLVLFSGCLDLMSTRQKQLCLSATHDSQTSIFDCSKTNDCYKKVNSYGMTVSDNVNYDIKNQVLVYKNNVASAIYYFNSAKSNINKINGFCSGEKDADIIKSINNLFFNLSKVFEYQDKSWQKSIELLKDYAIFLKENGVEQISEEEIYDSYILINQNLNELRTEENISENYVSILKIEAKNANELAKKFGFTQSYMADYGFVDLFAYYYEYVENPKKEIKLPVISKSSNYVFSRLSTIEQFLKINQSLQGADNYNLYILFDKEFGTNDSLFTKFVTLNNKINTDIDNVILKIKDYEENIDQNTGLLDDTEYTEYRNYKYKFNRNEIGFGTYLAKLKEFNSIIIDNLQTIENQNQESQKIVTMCESIITDAKNYENAYFKNLIMQYTIEENILKKEEYCLILKNSLNQRDCLNDYQKLVELNLIEEDENVNDFDCIDKVNQLNYLLENNEKIKLFKKIILDNEALIYDIKHLELDLVNEITILNYLDDLEKYNSKSNSSLIITIDKDLLDITNMNTRLTEMLTRLLSNYLENHYEIEYDRQEYFLVIHNPVSSITEICATLDLTNKVSTIDKHIEINQKGVCFKELNFGTNKFKINYENKQTIETKIIELELERGLYETIVENEVTGIYDSLNLGQIEVVDSLKYLVDENNNLWYITEKRNKILYYKKVFNKTAVDFAFEPVAQDFVLVERFKLKNISGEEFCAEVILLPNCYNCISLFKEDDTIKSTSITNGNLASHLCFEEHEEKLLELQKITNYSEITDDIYDLTLKINNLNNCEFSEINKLIKSKVNEIEKFKTENLSFDEIIKFYKLKTEVEEIEKQYMKLSSNVETIDLILARLAGINLIEKEKQQINAIELNKYNSPEKALLDATSLYNSVLRRVDSEKNIYESDFKNKIDNLIETGRTAGVIDEETINQLNSLSFSENNLKEFENIANTINSKIQTKSATINETMNYFKGLDIKEINDIINEVNYLYSETNLKELYAVKYYPIITLEDAERLNKKKDFLQTATLMQSFSKFESNYQEEDYINSIKYINTATLDRLTDINKEYNLLKSGVQQIKADATNELSKINQKYSKTKDKEIQSTISLIKKDFEDKKYLTVINKARSLQIPENTTIKLNYQAIVLSGLLIIFAFGYTKFQKKQKKLSKDEKKQKILRQY